MLLKKHLYVLTQTAGLELIQYSVFIGGSVIHHRRSRARSLTVAIFKIYDCGAKLTHSSVNFVDENNNISLQKF